VSAAVSAAIAASRPRGASTTELRPAQDARLDRARLGLGAFATMRLMASNVFRLSARAVTMTNNEMAVALRSGRTGHHRAVADQPRDRFIASARAFHASQSLSSFNHSRHGTTDGATSHSASSMTARECQALALRSLSVGSRIDVERGHDRPRQSWLSQNFMDVGEPCGEHAPERRGRPLGWGGP